MYTLHIPQGWKFYSYKFLEQVKIANCEDIKFSNKLKPITQHVALAPLWGKDLIHLLQHSLDPPSNEGMVHLLQHGYL